MLTLSDISKQSGLPTPFLRKSFKALEKEFEPFVERGEHNALLIDPNAQGIIDQIRELKGQNLSISAITRSIKTAMQTHENTKQKSSKTAKNSGETAGISELYERLSKEEKARHSAEIGRFQAENKLAEFKESILLLTDGRGGDKESAIKKRQEIDRNRGERAALASELKGLKWWQGKRRVEIADRLIKLDLN